MTVLELDIGYHSNPGIHLEGRRIVTGGYLTVKDWLVEIKRNKDLSSGNEILFSICRKYEACFIEKVQYASQNFIWTFILVQMPFGGPNDAASFFSSFSFFFFSVFAQNIVSKMYRWNF